MKFHLGLLCAILLAGAGSALAQGPDATYVRIYHVIQEADALAERGEDQQAVDKYREAVRALGEFQESHPRWHENIVKYRLNYLHSRLATLAPQEAAPDEKPDVSEPPPSTPEEMNRQLQAMSAEIQELRSQNEVLEEKLKEAWSARPTAADPEALGQAQSRIQDLLRERDLLQVALDRKQAALPSVEETSLLEQERRILADVRRQLSEQTQRAATLEQENEELKSQIATLKSDQPVSPVPDSDLSRQLAAATASLEDLRSTNVSLRTRIILLETQVADMMKAASRPTSEDAEALSAELKIVRAELKNATRDKERLEKQLASATRRLENRGDAGELEKEFQSAQARLQVLEAEAVPYTAEELALVDHGADLKMALSNEQALADRKPAELPPGAGPIMAQAERALANGQIDVAEQKLRDLLRQDENNVITLAKLGAVMMEKKDLEEADRLLQKATTVDPLDPASNYLLGILRYQQERYDEAFNALSLSSKANPNKPETQYFLGLTLLKKGNREPAETAFRKAIQLRPGWGMAHYELAFVYATQNPPYKELAEWHYQKAVSGGAPRNFELEALIEKAAPKSDAATE